MVTTNDIAALGQLVGEPARAAILVTLMDGRALTAAELARAAGVTPQTASGHLSRRVAGGLLKAVSQGRHRYHRLAGAEAGVRFASPARFAGLVAGAALRRSRRAGTCRLIASGLNPSGGAAAVGARAVLQGTIGPGAPAA